MNISVVIVQGIGFKLGNCSFFSTNCGTIFSFFLVLVTDLSICVAEEIPPE
jgi:hypothetical protein